MAFGDYVLATLCFVSIIFQKHLFFNRINQLIIGTSPAFFGAAKDAFVNKVLYVAQDSRRHTIKTPWRSIGSRQQHISERAYQTYKL